MKFSPSTKIYSRNSAFTFTVIEMVMSTVIIMMTVIALVSTEIYGSRVYTLAATQLSATDGARDTLDKVRSAIQSANGDVDVGNYIWANGSPTNFQLVTNGGYEEGNAIRIQASEFNSFSMTNPYTLIFLQPGNGGTSFATQGTNDQNQNLINTNLLIMEVFDTNYNPVLTNILASYITNQQVFLATDYTGTNIMTNSVNNRVFQITLMFSQWEYPIAVIGSNDINAYDYYRLQTRVAQRSLNF